MDIFARKDKGQVGRMLNRHLRWWEGDNNLISRTSSLLFALVYGSSFDEINLCIIDIEQFSRGVLIRDMDLIRAYHSFDAGLQDFEKLR